SGLNRANGDRRAVPSIEWPIEISLIPTFLCVLCVLCGGSSSSNAGLDPALLGRTAAVVGQGGDIFDGLDRPPRGLDRRDGALAPGARPLDLDLDLLDSILRGGRRGGLGRALRRERGALAAPLESDRPGRGPAQRIPVGVG